MFPRTNKGSCVQSMGRMSGTAGQGVGDIFAAVYSQLCGRFVALGLGQFSGSLLPRPTDLGGVRTSPIGIPNQNLSYAS
jgi:hypothetical protein